MKEHNIKSVDNYIAFDMKSMRVCVRFINGDKINIDSVFDDPDFYEIVKKKIRERVHTRERKIKLKKIKKKIIYGYIRKIFKRT
jgi:hypothetical protein